MQEQAKVEEAVEQPAWEKLSDEMLVVLKRLEQKRQINVWHAGMGQVTPENRPPGFDDLNPVHAMFVHDRRAEKLSNGMTLTLTYKPNEGMPLGYHVALVAAGGGSVVCQFSGRGVEACCGAHFIASFSGGDPLDGTINDQNYNDATAALLRAYRLRFMGGTAAVPGYWCGMVSAILNGKQRDWGWAKALVKAGFPATFGFRNTKYHGHAALTYHAAIAEEMDVPADCRIPEDRRDGDAHPVPGLPRGPEEGQGVLGNPP